MRVLVNLFDREPIKNVLSATIFAPEIAVFLCDKWDSNLFKESAVYRFFKRRGLRTRPRFYYFDAREPGAVRKALIAVVRDYPGCVFDFTGGRDLMLVLAGSISADLDLPAFYIDIRRGRFCPLRHCETFEKKFRIPRFSAEDLLSVTGAAVHGYGHVLPQQVEQTEEEDIRTVFEMLMKNTRAWGEFVSYLQVCCSGTGPEQLEVSGAKTMRGDKLLVQYNPALMQQLLEKGLLTQYSLDGKGVFFTFKSPLVKKWLLSAGVWLELFCYVTVRKTGFFHEVLSSVIIDWDGVEGGADTAKNEVDLLLVKGVTPVFVSCKMGMPSPLALCEVNQLAEKFAGNYGRSAVVTAQKLGKETAALRNRAEELGVLLLDRDNIEKKTLAKQLIKLASSPAPTPPSPPLPTPQGWKPWK
ncbi:DUF1887 family CARF protein [Ruminococcaceae bacterium OttesenSCG-928-I18]|nr:DUF1887 family CARF protein [Ruminococcaceae bacterium OttesenSCG-928-I18]